MNKTQEALKLALDTLKQNDEFLYLFHECESEEEIDQYTLIRKQNENAIAFAEKALAEESSGTEQPAQQHPDLSHLRPETQEAIRAWIKDGTFFDRAIGAMHDQEKRLMAYEKAQRQEPVAKVDYKQRDGFRWLNYLGWKRIPDGASLYTSPQPSKPLPEDYTALEQALTRLQKRYADLEGRASKPLTDEQKDAARYRWLKARLMGADFDWNESGACALVFEWPEDVPVGVDCDQNIDAAIEAAHGIKGGA